MRIQAMRRLVERSTSLMTSSDIDALKKRGRGRPGRGAQPSQVVALRLTSEELAELDARAAREHKTRSELIREALSA